MIASALIEDVALHPLGLFLARLTFRLLPMGHGFHAPVVSESTFALYGSLVSIALTIASSLTFPGSYVTTAFFFSNNTLAS